MEAVKIDSAITHASEEAEAGSIAIALTAAYAVNNDLEDVLERLHEKLPDSKVKTLVYSLSALLDTKHIAPSTALRVLGTKADVRETVPSALYCFLKFREYHEAIVAAIRAGGDTDTTAAIVGAMFGAKVGMSYIARGTCYQQVEDFDKLVELDSQLYNRSNGSFLIKGKGMKKKKTEPKETIIQIKFANEEAAMHFATWLCEAGEQDYWQWQECREEDEEGDITAISFHYHGPEDETKAQDDKARYGEFMCDNIIRTTVGRLDKR